MAYIRFASVDPQTSRKFLRLLISLAQQHAKDGWGGYIQMGALSKQASGLVLMTSILTNEQAKASMQPVTAFAAQLGNVVLNNEVTEVDSFLKAFNTYLLPNDELVGVNAAVGSRLIPSRNFDLANQEQLFTAMNAARAVVGDNVLGSSASSGSIVYGGAPEQILVTVPINHPNPPESAVTPAWRDALWHVLSAPAWNFDGSSVENQRKANQAAQFLRDITPGGGAYQNEASIFEPDPVGTFWGQANYDRLLKIKKIVDPDNIFTCWQCVGYNPNDPRFGCYPTAA